jgi:ADP-ribose pyrophosphatase
MPFRRLGEDERYRGPLIALATATFLDPDGGQFERDVVHHPGAVSVVPLRDDGRVVLVRQYRAAIDRDLLEIPAGKRDIEGEPPEATARRELVEEVGLQAERLELLAEFFNSPGFCDELSYVFLARGLTPCDTDAQGVEEQHMTIEEVTWPTCPP